MKKEIPIAWSQLTLLSPSNIFQAHRNIDVHLCVTISMYMYSYTNVSICSFSKTSPALSASFSCKQAPEFFQITHHAGCHPLP